MRTLTQEEYEKLKYLDIILAAIPLSEIKEMAEKEEVVAILKDKPIDTGGLILDMHNEVVRLRSDMATLQCNIQDDRMKLRELIQVLEDQANAGLTMSSRLSSIKYRL